jgi:hypothetical protein
MVTQTLTIAKNTFVESTRQPVLFILTLLCGVIQIFTTWSTGYSMGNTDAAEVSGDNKLLLDIGLSSVFVMGMLLAGFLATAVMSREIENKTVLTVVSKPIARPTVVLGKFLGVAGAISVAVVTMLVFLLLCIRHGVMSTAADEVDMPVVVFSLIAVGGALGFAGWANYFYGWSFPQMVTLLLAPLTIAAFIVVLFISKKWQIQPPFVDFKPQITLACAVLLLAVLVLTAIATAASTRLSQVMTITVCAGVFLASLLTNYFLGRMAYSNDPIGRVAAVVAANPRDPSFATPGDFYEVTLELPATRPLVPGDFVRYGPNPNGFDLQTPSPKAPRFEGNLDDPQQTLGPNAPRAIVLNRLAFSKGAEGSAGGRPVLTLRHMGPEDAGTSSAVRRPPEQGDYVFVTPTEVRPAYLVAWAVVPNLHYFWLLDAVSQNVAIPVGHVGLIALYSLLQIGACLSLAVMLFQKRDVG